MRMEDLEFKLEFKGLQNLLRPAFLKESQPPKEPKSWTKSLALVN